MGIMDVELPLVMVRTDQEFITSDDPICCYSPKLKHVEYGLGHDDCEVTVPLSRKLCLLIAKFPQMNTL